MIKKDALSVLVCICTTILLVLPGTLRADSAVGQWTGSHTRLVWVQDQGNGADTFAQGEHLKLIGFDSADGKGERELLAETSNFFKPLFTPDGEHVVVSNRRTRQMYLVEWQTGKKTDLGSGVAVAVWQDPKKSFLLRRKTTWVYCFSGSQGENKYGTAQPLYRFPIDKPGKLELVWDKTNMAWSNLQLSRDGSVLGGLFPWPHGGVLWTKDSRWQRFGRGCWTSVSPDNSKLLWIFDGLHRNIQVHDVSRGENWKVNINSGPGIGGFEVYHPRWTNHPRYFVLTGPYEKGDGGNRIGGGGEKVEIYLGRFDNQARAVEDWIKVTDNKRADFYPDAWIENGSQTQLADSIATSQENAVVASWPSARDHLVFLWENMKSANQLGEGGPVGFYQCNLELRGTALHTRYYQLSAGGGWAETGDAGKVIGDALKKTKKMSVEFMLTPQQDQQASIMSFSSAGAPFLSVRQQGENLEISAGGGKPLIWPGLLVAQKAHHLVAVMDGTTVEVYRDGRSVGQHKLAIDFGRNAPDSFVLGDMAGKWHGTLEMIAVYDSSLMEEYVAHNAKMAADLVAGRMHAETLVVEASLAETTAIPAPEAIGAYRRALVVNTYTVDRVEQGSYGQERILVAEWAILDRRIVKQYPPNAERERLVLELFDAHPELEGERQMMDIFEPELDMYYRLPEV